MPLRKMGFASMILSMVLLSAPCATAAVQWVGNVSATSVGKDSATFQIVGGGVGLVQMMAPDVVRVRFNPTGVFTSAATGAVVATGFAMPGTQITDTAGATYLVTSAATVIVVKNPFQVVVLRSDGSFVDADLAPGIGFDSQTGLIFDLKYAPATEHYFGLGERGGPIDRRGRSIFMENIDWAGYTEFSDPLYASIPFYYGLNSGQAYGVFFDNAAFPFFNMDAAHTGVSTMGAMQGELDYYVLVGPTPQQVATNYDRLTGFPPLPPKWSLGYQQSRYTYGSSTEVLQVASQFRAQQIPCDALYLDLGYMNQQRMFTWDPTNFPNPVGMNSSLASQGFATINIFDPVALATDPLWPYLSGSGYLLTDSTGTSLVNSIFYGNVSWLDFTNPAASTWYKSTLKTFLQTGVTAVWNDLNEPAQNYMSQAIYAFGGQPRTDLQARDLYALNETAASFQAQAELRPNARPWVLSRSGFSGIQRYAAMWSGDTSSSFDSLRVSVELSQSMGLSGVAQFGHDVGGFLGSPSAELFIRWLEFSSMTPMFRTHSDATVREPWVYGEPYTTIARNTINFRYQLLPYLYSLSAMASTTGQPPLAPAFFYFPNDPQTYSQDQEFMVGPNLLVAPVITAGATSRTVYLPADTNWIDYHNDTAYAGGQTITVNAPLETLPIFVRQGTVLPNGPIAQYTGQVSAPQLNLDIYPGTDGSFSLYEDDGTTTSYTQGAYLLTSLSTMSGPNGLTITSQRVAGAYQPAQRPIWMVVHQMSSAPTSVQLNSSALLPASSQAGLLNMTSGWYYDQSTQRVFVRFADSATLNTVLIH